MSEKYKNALRKLSGIQCALQCLDEPLKDAAADDAAVQGVRTIIDALEFGLGEVYEDLAKFRGRGERRKPVGAGAAWRDGVNHCGLGY